MLFSQPRQDPLYSPAGCPRLPFFVPYFSESRTRHPFFFSTSAQIGCRKFLLTLFFKPLPLRRFSPSMDGHRPQVEYAFPSEYAPPPPARKYSLTEASNLPPPPFCDSFQIRNPRRYAPPPPLFLRPPPPPRSLAHFFHIVGRPTSSTLVSVDNCPSFPPPLPPSFSPSSSETFPFRSKCPVAIAMNRTHETLLEKPTFFPPFRGCNSFARAPQPCPFCPLHGQASPRRSQSPRPMSFF